MDRKQAAKRHFRRLIVESLEQRKMLTVTPPIDNNDTLALADPIQLYAGVPFNVVDYIGNGSQASADVDVFRISLKVGDQLSLDIDAKQTESGSNISTLSGLLRVFDSNGNPLASSNGSNSSTDDPKLDYLAAGTGTYYVSVSSFENNSFSPGTLSGRVANQSLGKYQLHLLVLPSTSIPATYDQQYTVSTRLESTAGDNLMSLREAVEAANSSGGNSLIQFALADAERRVELLWGALQLNSHVAIQGPTSGNPLTVGLSTLSSPTRLMQIGSGANVRISNVQFFGGQSTVDGGALLINGELHLNQVEVRGNQANRGGAAFVSSAGSLFLSGVTLAENIANNGGAIFVDAGGKFIATQSTIGRNSATNASDAIENNGYISIYGSTIARNGVVDAGHQAVVNNASGTFYLLNTLIASNYTTNDTQGDFFSQGFNLVGNAGSATGLGWDTSLHDQVGGANGAAPLDGKVGTLQLQGGRTRSMLLLAGSPALDAASSFGAPAMEQRGAERNLDGIDLNDPLDNVRRVDIGATEFGTFFVNSELDTVDASPLGDGVVDSDISTSSPQITLRGAIQELNALAGLDGSNNPARRNMQGIIVLDRNVLLTRKGSDEDFAVTGDLDVFGNLQVQGFRGQQYLIDGGWGPTTPSEVDLGDRIFHALPGSTLRFTDLSIGGGRVVSMASTFSSFGGSILNDSATLDMDHVQLRGSQSNRGGAVYSRSGEVNFKGSSVVDSRASKGGAFYLESGSLTVSNSTVTRNAADAGGGVYVYTGSLIINDHSHLNENFASLSGLAYGVGGAIYNATGSVVISGKTELRGNYLSNGWHGAAIANYGQMLIEDGSDVSANGAYMGMPSSSGGPDDAGIWDTHANALAAIYNDGIMNVVDSTISDNSVGGVLNDSELTFRRTVISGNHDNHAGTGLFNRNGNMTLLDSRVENNSTPMYAPGILNFDLDAKLTVINTTFSGNTSEGSGSAIWNKHGTVNVVNSLFLENKQSKLSLGGGAIYNEGTNKLIGRTPGSVLTLAADVNNSQSILFLNGLSPIRNLPLPLLLEIEGEIVKVTSLDEFRSAVIVERELPMIHSVSSNVSLHIGATQEFIPLEDAESFRRYKLPLDVVVDLEVVTITKIQGNVAYVQRGRRGSVATNHAQPSDIWAVSGSLQVSNSSFVSNVLDVLGSVNPSRLPTQGGAISNTTSSFVAPTLINGVTFTNNAGVVGSAISNSVNVPIFVSKREDLIPQHGAKPLWKVLINASWPEAVLDTLPVTSLVVSNSVFDGNTLPSGTWTPAVAGAATTSTTNPGKFSNLPYNLEPANQVFLNKIKRVSNAGMISGGGNIVDVELNSFSFLERSVLPEDTSLVIIKPGNGLPTTPFKMRLSHVAWGQIYYEEVLVTSVTKIPDLHPVPKTSSSNPTVAITEYVELTTVRGFDGTQAIAHPKGARIIVSRNGFWQPGDKIGTLDDVKIVRITEINAPNGITKEETVVTVRDTSHFPKAPFNIHVFHQEGSNEVYEMMTVTAINGLALKVIRGASYSDPLIHPDHSRVEFDELISDRLDPRLEPLSLDRFPTNSGQLQSTSPAVENSRYMANFLNASATTSGLSATFNSSTDAYMAFFDSTRTLASYSFSDETTLRLSSVTGLPAIPFFLRIDDEIVRVTSVSSANTNVTVNRGQFGTIASDHRTGNSIVVGTNIDAQSTAIHVASTIGMPQTPFVISIGAELGRVVAINQITKTITVARGEFGTTAVTQAGGTKATYGRWLTVTPQTAYPSPPFHATLGDELVRVTAVNVPFHLLTIERGADRSTLQDHSPTVPLLYDSKGATRGFQGLGSITLQAVAQDSTQINIREIARLPKLFEVRIGNERLQVTNVVNNADGSQLLSVVRGVENTIPASYAKGSNVMILIDQSMNRRQVDGDGNGIIERDSGATESIHFGVNSFADLPDLDPGNGRIDTGTSGIVTLRAAIMESNALGGSAQIDLPAGNIIVYSPLFVSADIEIIGLAADQTTVSGSSSRIFEIASDGRLKIASVTLSGGNTVGNGGAVLVTGGSFAAQNSVIHGSSATGNGGAIASVQGSVRLTSSTLVNNIALQGGAIHNDRGSLTIASSTVSSNQAGSTAGAIYNSSGGHIHIFSSTIAFNTATSGPAGISNAGRVDIANTILANNLTSGSIFETAGPFVSQGYNLVDVAVGPIATLGQPVDQNSNFLSLANALPAGFTVPFNVRVADNEVMTVTAVQGLLLTVLRSTVSSERFSHPIGSAIRGDGFWEVGELIGTSASPIDPQLLPLELNGGSVPTHALAAGSQAIDAGNGILAKGIQTFLSSGAKIGESRLLVTSTIGLPSAPFKIRVDSESLTVTEISGHLLTVEGMSNVHRYGAIVKVLADQRAAPRIANAAGVNIFVPEGSSNGGGSDPYGYGGMGGNNGTGGSGTNNSSSSTSKMDIGAFERVTMVSLAGGQSTIAEGSPGASVPYTFTIHRDGIIDVTTTVEYVVRGLDSGLRASDFADDVVPRAFVTFSPGETVKSITLYIAGDRVVEPNEPFVVELRSFSPDLMIHHDHLLSTIIDDDYAELIISSVPTPEGITLRFIGQLSAPIQDGFELNWKTASQSAILDQDFDPSIGTLMVEGAANEWVGLDVITLSDEVVELDETLGLQISRKFPPGIANRVSVTSLATGTIKNDDTTSLSVRNITVTEGDSGNRNVAFEVTTGTNPVDVPFTVTLGASDLTATNNVDFVAATSVLSFSGQSGQTQSYVVSIVGDSSVEIDEQFVVNALSVSASGRQASINVSAGTGTIINDDGPRIVVLSRGAKETDSGEFVMTFDVTLTSPLGHPVSVTASTLAGSAVAGVDYVAKSGTLLFSGLSNQTLPFYVTIKGDTLEELDEQFEVNLSDLQASGDLYSLANGTGTIYNDDKIGFTVVVPSSIAPIPGSKPHIVAATSDLANAPPLLIQLTGASGDLPFGATLDLIRVGTAEPLYHQQITFQSGNGFSTLFTLPEFAVKNDPEFISILLSDVHEIANGYGGGGGGGEGGNTRGNHSWAVQVEPTRTKNAPVCEGLLPIDDYRNTGTFEGVYELLPVYVYWVNEQTASGALGGHWVAANGEHPPGPGLWGGITYSNNLEDIPDTTNAIKGDLGFGRDKYGYAVVPSTNGNENFLIGSVQRQNAGNLDVFLKRKAGKSELKNGPGKCSFPEVPPVEVPPIGIISDIHADWVIPFTESFTFNPFPSFNYRLTPSAGLTVRLAGGGFAQVGTSVPLRFGTVVVNPDDTLTYTPASNLTSRTGSEALQPERDPFGNIIRFTGIDQFESHIVERNAIDPSIQSSPSNIYGPMQLTFASTPVVLAVANTLPTTKGSFSRTNAPSTLDSLVFADMNTSYSVDLKDLFLDADGAMDVSKLRVVQIEYMNEHLDASKNTTLDPHPTQIRIPIGNRPGTIEVLDPNMGIPIVNLGPRAENSLVVSSTINTSIIEIENTVTQQIEDSTFPSRIELTVKVTDGQKEKYLNAQNQIVSRDHIIELVIAIRPRVRESSGLWRIQTGIPDIDVSPWVKSQTPPLSDRYDAATQITKDIPFKLNATSSTLKATDKSQIVADTDANLFSGSIHRRQELILDGSGGDSELSLPGLIYSSSYVPASSVAKQTDNLVFASFTKPVGMEVTSLSFQLTWYDYAENVTQIVPTSITVPASKLQQWLENTVNEPIVVALQPGRVPKQTGVYPWQVKTTVGYNDGTVSKTAILYANGETPVVVIDDKGPFGTGWAMEDVPILVYDPRPSPSGGDSSDPLDDRLMLIFPGQTPRLFNAASLAVTNGNFNGQLPNIDVGSEGISYDGARAPDEFGTLESTSNSQFLTYTAADNVKYVFERYVWGGKKQYAISRIEPAGLAYNEADWNGNTKRRGISFTWEPESNYNSALPVPRKGLTLTASDGKTTTFDYLTSDQVRSIRRVSSLYNLSYSLYSQLNKIEIVRDPTRTDSREFTYDNDFHLKTDKWFSFGGSQKRLDYLTTYDYATNGFLNKVTVGDTQASYDVTPAAQFAMGAIGLGKLVGRVEQTVTDLKKYDLDHPDVGLDVGSTTNRTDYRFSPNGLLQEHSEFINPVGESPQPLTSEKWEYNAYGSLARYTDPLDRKTIYWYDYQIPATVNGTADASIPGQRNGNKPNTPKTDQYKFQYDQDDYRGNVSIIASRTGFTRYFYETADKAEGGLGQIVQVQENPKINGAGTVIPGGQEYEVNTYYQRREDGRVWRSQTVRGNPDSYPATETDLEPTPPSDFAERDAIERFEHGSNGFKNRSIDLNGLQTNYVFANRRVTQQNSFDAISNTTTTTNFNYDAFGFIDTAKSLSSALSSGVLLSTTDYDYDAIGNLVQVELRGPGTQGNTTSLSRKQYTYDAMGRVVSTRDGLNVESTYQYSTAGLLTQSVQAKDQTYTSRYTGTPLSVAQTTNYAYYSDGSIKEVVRPDGSLAHTYLDPANLLSWQTQTGVSNEAHSVGSNGSISISRNGISVTETQTDQFGRVIRTKDLLTSAETKFEYTDIRVDSPTITTSKVNHGQNTGLADRVLRTRYDAQGRALATIDSLQHLSTTKYDNLGNLLDQTSGMWASGNLVSAGITSESVVTPAGQTASSTLRPIRAVSYSADSATTEDSFDNSGRPVRIKDPGQATETNTMETRITYDVENAYRTITTTDRSGGISKQWIDAAGRTVKTKDPYGSITQFEYDANGQLRKQRIFAASNDPTFTTRETQFQYDALGRQRVVITLGSDPQYQATDYFNPGDGGADGWDQVDFLPLPGSDPTASVANLKSRATKSIYDSIGKLLYVQAPDPSLLNNGTTLPSAKWPAQLFTYSYDTTAQTLTTKRELGLVTNGPTSPSIDLSAPNVRKTQTIDNSSGETIEVERWVPGTSSPTSGSFILVSKSQYNSAGEKIHTWTPLGGSDATALTQTDFRYDSQSRLISTKNISGETKQEFDGYGNLVTTTDALNDMTKHSYDKLNRLLATKEASGAQQSMTFNGRAKTHTIDENATTSIEYDLLGRVESRTPPGRGKIKYKYDTVGNLLSIEDGEGLTTTWTYDSLNRPRTETDSNGFITKKIYDLAGNLISVVDPLGHETISVYDALNRLVSTTDALQYTTYMSYDASGNRLSLTDPENNKTQWTYDSFDRVLTETNQLNNTRSYAYYSDGRERLLTKADGNQIRYTYDLAAHTSKEEWLNGSGAVTKTLDFEYNAVGDLLDASDSDSSVHWLYESGLLRQESLSLPNNISVQFVNRYKDDVLQSVTTKLGGIQDSKVAYSYTADGLLEQIQQTGYNVSTKSVRYSYDQAARRTRVTRFTDVDNLTAVFRTDYRYTNTSNQQTDRLQSLKHKTALSSLVEYKFVWDAASRLKSVESPGGDGLSSFTYDTVNQLTGATYSSNISNLSFSYDSNGNRNNADNVPGVDNRQQSDSEWTYQYDDNGNLVRQTNKSNGSVVEYTFDVRNRLTDVSFRGSLGGTLTKGVHYGYDAINRRISRALDSNGDGSADVMEYFVNYGQRASRGGAGDELALVLKGDGEVKTRVLHGALVDEVLAEENVTSPTNRDVLWALADQQGSVRDLARVTNGQVQVVDHIQYDAFGNTVSETDTAIAHLYGYTGREFDKETGLQYNRARYYDPSNGRLLSKDPIGFAAGDTNLYRMTGNHPNMATDPSGLFEDGLMTLNLNPTRKELEAGRRLELELMIGAIEESNALRAAEERARGRSKLLRGLGVPESQEHLYGEVKYEALEFFGWVNAIERENAESASYREYLRRRNDAKAVFIGVSILGGSIETGTGIALSIAGLGSPITVLGVAMTAHGGDGLTATIRSMGSDEPIDTFTSKTFQAAGMPRGYANLADVGVGLGLGLGAGGLLRSARLASPSSSAANASTWTSRFPGVQVRQYGNAWVKRVNPDSSPLMQSWGRMTIERQAAGLDALRAAGRPAASSRLYSSGRLIVEDVGRPLGYSSYLKPGYWGARARDSRAMGTFMNDLRPGNYGAGYRAFDPALDPITSGLGITGGIGAAGVTIYYLDQNGIINLGN